MKFGQSSVARPTDPAQQIYSAGFASSFFSSVFSSLSVVAAAAAVVVSAVFSDDSAVAGVSVVSSVSAGFSSLVSGLASSPLVSSELGTGGASVGGAGVSSSFFSPSVVAAGLSSAAAASSFFSSLVSSSGFSSTLLSSADPLANLPAFFLKKLKDFLKDNFFLMLVALDSFFFSSSVFSPSVSLLSPSPFSSTSVFSPSAFSASSFLLGRVGLYDLLNFFLCFLSLLGVFDLSVSVTNFLLHDLLVFGFVLVIIIIVKTKFF